MTENDRTAAAERLKGRRAFQQSLVAYLIVNVMLLVIWAITGAGFFWPGFVLLFWGVGLAFQAYNVYGRRQITEEDIAQEMQRS